MMGQPKPFAALSSALLARKGQAKPAMRPQGFSGFGAISEAIDDLGWNDMGQNDLQPATGAETPMPIPAPMPPVLPQRHATTDDFAAAPPAQREAPVSANLSAPAPDAAPRAPAKVAAQRVARTQRKRDASVQGREIGIDRAVKTKTAFTLRLDGDRHLRLRLASVLRHQSAQQLVTEALDTFLKTLPQVEAMATRLSSGAGNDMDDGG